MVIANTNSVDYKGFTFGLDWDDENGCWTMDITDKDFDSVDNDFTSRARTAENAIKSAKKYIREEILPLYDDEDEE